MCGKTLVILDQALFFSINRETRTVFSVCCVPVTHLICYCRGVHIQCLSVQGDAGSPLLTRQGSVWIQSVLIILLYMSECLNMRTGSACFL